MTVCVWSVTLSREENGRPTDRLQAGSINTQLTSPQESVWSLIVRLCPPAAGQRPGAVQELPSGHIGALAAGSGGDGLRGGQLGHGQVGGSQEGEEQAARPRRG